MKEIPEDRQIYISARLWHEIYPKVRLAPFIYALHEGIDLSNNGDGLCKFYFTFLILKPDNKLHFPGTYFDKEKKEAEIALKIAQEEAQQDEEYGLACLEAVLGNPERALIFLEKALQKGQVEPGWVRIDPEFTFMSDHPGFLALIEK